MTNIIIAITLIATYTLVLCAIGRKVPKSLSQSVFMIPPHASWLWTVVIGTVAVLILPTMMDVAGDNWKFLPFLSIVGLLFVALCPLSPNKSGQRYVVHMIGAWICAVCSQLMVAVTDWHHLLLWVPWIVVYVLRRMWFGWDTKVFWAEMTCFATIFILLLSR